MISHTINTVSEALKDLQKGKMIILVDDIHRENEGDFVVSAEKITPEHINFMAQEGRGLVCLSLTQKTLNRLDIPMMTSKNKAHLHTAFTVSIEAAHGVTTGSSAFDRAHTIRTAVAPKSTSDDLVTPGHVFPLAAAEGGVFARRGHTEGSVDLMRLAGLHPSAVICEIMKKNGHMARLPDLKIIAKKYNLKIISIEQIIQYRIAHDPVIQESARAVLPLEKAKLDLKIFTQPFEDDCHVVLYNANVKNKAKNKSESILVRIHSECLTGDVFGSLRCDCGEQLKIALDKISEEGGILLYMRQEGRGIGLLNKIKAYGFQDSHQLDTVEANQKLGFPPDVRDYMISAQILSKILSKLEVKKIRLLTNNPHKIKALQNYGIEVTERVPLLIPAQQHNQRYLKTKRDKLGHLF